jgi:peptide/nickel transport system substrate-binding protein
MESITGNDPTALNLCKAMFPCGTAYGQEIGGEAMQGNLDKARAMLKAAGLTDVTITPTSGGYAAITGTAP